MMTSNQRTKHKGTAHLQNRKTYSQNGRRKTEHSWQTKNPITEQMISKRQATKSDDLLTPWIATTKRKQDKGADREKGNNRNLSRENQLKTKHPNNKEASCKYQNSSTLNIELLMRFGMLFRLSLNLSSKKVYHSIIPISRVGLRKQGKLLRLTC
jgi:hypothetical protein